MHSQSGLHLGTQVVESQKQLTAVEITKKKTATTSFIEHCTFLGILCKSEMTALNANC